MEIIKTILIAIVQGISEFLPISSSGHIVLFEDVSELLAHSKCFFYFVFYLLFPNSRRFKYIRATKYER